MLHHATGHAAHRHHHYHPAASSVSAYQQHQHSFQPHPFQHQHQHQLQLQQHHQNQQQQQQHPNQPQPSPQQQQQPHQASQQHLQSQLQAALVDSSALVSPISMSPQFATAGVGPDGASFQCGAQQLAEPASYQHQAAAAAAVAYQHQQEQQFVDHFMSMQQQQQPVGVAQHFPALHPHQHQQLVYSAQTGELANLDQQQQLQLEHSQHLQQPQQHLEAPEALVGLSQAQADQFEAGQRAEEIELEDYDTMSSCSHDELTGQRKKRGKFADLTPISGR